MLNHMQHTTGSEIQPFRKPCNMGWLFSLVMVSVGFLILISFFAIVWNDLSGRMW